METAADILPEILPFCGPSGSTDPVVGLEYINQCRNLLWNKRETSATLEYICVCSDENDFYLPSAYKQVRLLWMGREPVSVGDEWYVSVPQVGLGDYHMSCHKKMNQIGGHFVTFRNYTYANYQIAVQPENPEDENVQITVFGLDEYGTSKKETYSLGQAGQFSLSQNFYQNVSAVIKPTTKGRVRLYAIDPVANVRMLLAIYQPYDINPNFRKFSIQGLCYHKQVTACVKKKYFPFQDPNNLVEFPTDAIKLGIQALVFQKDRDIANYTNYLSDALLSIDAEESDNEIPTASPMRFMHNEDVVQLIGGHGWGV
jgi:hypothetical protein